MVGEGVSGSLPPLGVGVFSLELVVGTKEGAWIVGWMVGSFVGSTEGAFVGGSVILVGSGVAASSTVGSGVSTVDSGVKTVGSGVSSGSIVGSGVSSGSGSVGAGVSTSIGKLGVGAGVEEAAAGHISPLGVPKSVNSVHPNDSPNSKTGYTSQSFVNLMAQTCTKEEFAALVPVIVSWIDCGICEVLPKAETEE